MKFYKFESNDDEYYDAIMSTKNERETFFCHNEGTHRSGRRGRQLYIELLTSGIGDFVWILNTTFMITDKVKDIFEKAGLTGYTLQPVIIDIIHKVYITDNIEYDGKGGGEFIKEIIVDKDPKPVPPLYEMVITGDGGVPDPRTGIKLDYECKECGVKKFEFYGDNGFIVDKKNWDGSDFFKLYPSHYIFVTEKVKQVVEENGLTNAKFILSTEVENAYKKNGWKITLPRPWERRNEFMD